MSCTAAEVDFHLLQNLLTGRTRIIREDPVGIDHHTRDAKAALEGIVLDKGSLDRVQLALLGQTLDSQNFFSGNRPDAVTTGANRLLVHKDGTSSAQALAATILASRQFQVSS